ncbi:MAG: thioredoxin family protein [Erythrobacter sp.]
MSVIAAPLLLLLALQTGADFAEVEAQVEERGEAETILAIAADAHANAGADFVAKTDDADGAAHNTEKGDEADDDKPDHPEAKLYDASIDATAAVDAALTKAQARGVNVLLVLGANWCHDSRAFAGWSETEKIGGLIAERYELLFINVGMPQTDDGHNLHIADRFELGELEGTPTVVVLSPDGKVLNRETAKSWRNTASRSEDEIYDELALLATAEVAAE